MTVRWRQYWLNVINWISSDGLVIITFKEEVLQVIDSVTAVAQYDWVKPAQNWYAFNEESPSDNLQ